MEKVSWMFDYLPIRMLALAQRAERRFEQCLMSCPKTDGGVIKIDDREVFTRLLDERITSLELSIGALDSYLAWMAYEAAKKIEEEIPGIMIPEYVEKYSLDDIVKQQSNRIRRRHESIIEEHGAKTMYKFLTTARLSLEDKIFYIPLIRAKKLLSYKDGNVKKMLTMISLRDELLNPAFANVPEIGKIRSAAEIREVFLTYPAPDSLTPGVSCSDDYGTETYNEYHFFWELLHCYPTRTVQEFIQYLHNLDGTEYHAISVLRQAELVDDSGNPLTREERMYALEFDMGG